MTSRIPDRKLPFESVALLLQGGGALGAYQGGVYQALHEAGIQPNWIAGISIGAINAAIIAGNKPEERLTKLHGFWQAITASPFWNQISEAAENFAKGDTARSNVNQLSAAYAMTSGVPGFFKPHLFAPFLYPPGTLEATSFYDTASLRATLMQFIDFDLLNNGDMRLSVGAVNVRSGNFVCFDTGTHKIGPDHIMASGALPPGFPAVEIEGQYYWDGGIISNTPLQWVTDQAPREDTLAFQVDLWNAEGQFPRTMVEVETRRKEIQYSSRTRANTDRFREDQKLRHAFARLVEEMPEELKKTEEFRLLSKAADHKVYSIVHLIYRAKNYEGHSKDFEFSRLSMEEHWQAGYHDTVRTLRHPDVLKRPDNPEGVFTFDVSQDG